MGTVNAGCISLLLDPQAEGYIRRRGKEVEVPMVTNY